MLVINDMLMLSLRKTHTGWKLTMPDKNLLALKGMVDQYGKQGFEGMGKVVTHFIENIDNTIGKQGTSYHYLSIRRELVANWIINGEEYMLPVVKHLTEKERELFFNVYANHNRSMGLEKRAKYLLGNVVKVESKPKERCLHVHYDHGEWWHYTEDGTWY